MKKIIKNIQYKYGVNYCVADLIEFEESEIETRVKRKRRTKKEMQEFRRHQESDEQGED